MLTRDDVWGCAKVGAALAFTAVAVAFTLVATGLADSPTVRQSRVAAPEQPAPSIFSYTGIYVGGGLGGGIALGEISNANVEHKPDFNIDSAAAYGLLGDARLGLDWQIGGSPILVGLFAGYQFGETEFNVRINDTSVLNATVESDMYAGGRAGLVFGSKGLLYVGYIYQPADLVVTVGSERQSASLSPHNVIGGLEYPLAGGLALGLEYKYRLAESNTFFDSVDVDTDEHVGMVRLNFRPFGGLF